jgi:hypothetical protein
VTVRVNADGTATAEATDAACLLAEMVGVADLIQQKRPTR